LNAITNLPFYEESENKIVELIKHDVCGKDGFSYTGPVRNANVNASLYCVFISNRGQIFKVDLTDYDFEKECEIQTSETFEIRPTQNMTEAEINRNNNIIIREFDQTEEHQLSAGQSALLTNQHRIPTQNVVILNTVPTMEENHSIDANFTVEYSNTENSNTKNKKENLNLFAVLIFIVAIGIIFCILSKIND
jgi:hypothetical protein